MYFNATRLRFVIFLVLGLTVLVTGAAPAQALDEEHYVRAREMIDRAIGYLRTQQDERTGGWAVPEQGPAFPGISALVMTGMLMEPDIDGADPAIARGVEFLLSYRQEDGGIYDRILPSYNTSLCLSALTRINTADAAAAITPAQDFLRSVQWSTQTVESPDSPDGEKVDETHPFFGGIGYGRHGRPDNSNLNFMLQGLHDSGLDCDDVAFQRAAVFLARTQMHEAVNEMAYAKGSTQGGFIYATSPEKDQVGAGESKAGMIEETLDNGEHISRLRAYGSMSYAGFKSYIYANLDRDDPRVQLAYDWIRRNYTLEENPGVGLQGFYYYMVTFSRALDAWGLSHIQAIGEDGATIDSRDWANDLIDRLAELQNEDGSFKSVNSRWMEDNPVLITAHALLALQHGVN